MGEELLTVELGKAENNPHHALDILDFFQVSRFDVLFQFLYSTLSIKESLI